MRRVNLNAGPGPTATSQQKFAWTLESFREIERASQFLDIGSSPSTVRTALGVQQAVTANTTYFVRSDGNDGNTGLANSSSGAFLTIGKALSATSLLYLGGFTVTVQVVDGTYATGGSLTLPASGGAIILQGNTSSPQNVVLTDSAISVSNGAALSILGFELRGTSSAPCLSATTNGIINLTGAMRYGAATNSHQFAAAGGIVINSANYTISGSPALGHWRVSADGILQAISRVITLTGTPAFGSGTSAFAWAEIVGNITATSTTFVGSGTGQRYFAQAGGVIFTSGGGANYLPGDSAGNNITGGIYA